MVAKEPSLSIGAYNGGHTVISGPAEVVAGVMQRLGSEGVRCVELVTSHAFHSMLLEPMLDDLEAAAGEVEPRGAELVLISNLTGRARAGGADAGRNVLASACARAGAVRP